MKGDVGTIFFSLLFLIPCGRWPIALSTSTSYQVHRPFICQWCNSIVVVDDISVLVCVSRRVTVAYQVMQNHIELQNSENALELRTLHGLT